MRLAGSRQREWDTDAVRPRRPIALTVAIVVYVATVVLANFVTDRFGLVTVGFGLMVTAGTYAAGVALLARDLVHRYGNRVWALMAIGLGGVISWATASPALAVASTVAFVSAELVDLVVYEPIRKARGFIAGALASNLVSAPVDTVVFLNLAGFPVTYETVGGQYIGKVLWATLLPLTLYWVFSRISSRTSAGRERKADLGVTAQG